jgi:hypothetical protein
MSDKYQQFQIGTYDKKRIIWNLWFWPDRHIMCIGMSLKMFHLIGFGWFIMALIILSNSHIIILFCVAGVRPGSRGTFVSAKVPKTIDAQSGLMR